jgi:aminopeptidase YwaD
MPRIPFFIITCFLSLTLWSQNYEYRIAKQCDQVDSVYQLIEAYQNIGIKATGTPGFDSATRWLSDRYTALGYKVSIDSFLMGSMYSTNIIIEKKGRDTTSWLIVGAHYDTKGESPGANDNGSGVAATLEIARLIKDIGTDISVRIINFGAEEQGFYGSYHYANTTLDPEDNVLLMFNLDQLGGSKGKDNRRIVCERDENNEPSTNNIASYLKTDTLVSMIELYTTLIPVTGLAERSDYEPFQDLGYVVNGLYQESKDDNYHSAQDLVSNMDTEATTEVIKGALAATLYFAGINSIVGVSNAVQEQFFIYPNPAHNLISVHLPYMDSVEVSIISITGEELLTRQIKQTANLDISHLPAGSYTVSISSEDNSIMSYSKLIIAK